MGPSVLLSMDPAHIQGNTHSFTFSLFTLNHVAGLPTRKILVASLPTLM